MKVRVTVKVQITTFRTDFIEVEADSVVEACKAVLAPGFEPAKDAHEIGSEGNADHTIIQVIDTEVLP